MVTSCTYKPTLQLFPNEVHQAAQYRLGVNDRNHQGNIRCRQCDKVQNPRDQGLPYEYHSTPCHGGGSFHRRHNRFKKVISHTLKEAGYSPQLETAHLIPGSLILEMSTCMLVMTARQLHMTSNCLTCCGIVPIFFRMFYWLLGGHCITQESRPLCEQLRQSGDTPYPAGAGVIGLTDHPKRWG
jgi:hypothetical protein